MIASLVQVWRLFLICGWRRPGGRVGLVYFAVVFGFGLVSVHLTVRLIRWSADFYNALQKLDVPAAVHQIGVFFTLIAISASLHLISNWLRKLLQIIWRRTLTDAVLDEWLAGKAYWHLRDRTEHGLDNPDQRIADDCRIFIFRLTTEALEFVTNCVAIVTYFSVLWSLSDFPLAFTLFGLDVSIPRYMVWAAPLYVAISSGLTHLLGKPLIPLNVEQQKVEADFRFSLARLRQSVEQVALAGGEPAERRIFGERFTAIVGNWRQLMNRELILGCFTRPYMQTVLRLPLFLALPAFLAGKLTFGGLMQMASAFQNVVTTLSWFIFSYRDLAELFACAKRLDHFIAASREVQGQAGAIRHVPGERDVLHLGDVRLSSPAGEAILGVADLKVARGESVWLKGPSGLGKTTMLRAIAGIWPHGEGTIARPEGHVTFLPQQPYVPLGTVAAAAVYPKDPAEVAPETLSRWLRLVGLGRLAAAAETEGASALASLSGGERQRLALVRVLAERPDWAFLDEATSALDLEAEKTLLQALRAELPQTTFVVVSHREPTGLGPLRVVELAEAGMRAAA